MKTPTSAPPTPFQSRFVAIFGNWPVICFLVSTAFLSTVYVLGGFKNGYAAPEYPQRPEAMPPAAAPVERKETLAGNVPRNH